MPELMIMCKPRYFNLIYINPNGQEGNAKHALRMMKRNEQDKDPFQIWLETTREN